jgi:6-phosphogluconolactonase
VNTKNEGTSLPVVVEPDPEKRAERAADEVVSAATAAIEERGRFAVAFSGGSTPAGMLAALAGRPLPWDRVHVFQVDERVAPAGHDDRNLNSLVDTLGAVLPEGNLHPMPVEADDLEAAAARYADELAEVAGGELDLVHLGLGDDGHTASWPPGDPVLGAGADVALAGPYEGRRRMTLTPPAVNRARRVLWLVEGEKKASMLARLLEGDEELPAAAVRRDRALVVDDPVAAGGPG